MIAWKLTSTTLDAPEPAPVADGAAVDRTAAIRDAADATRAAVMNAPNTETLPTYTLTIDGDLELILGLGRNALAAIDIDQALDYIDAYEHDALTAPVENAAHIGARGRAAEPQ
ncbi:hypothetical protein GS504_03400 [Rhodococcus hoagii]|nr:hypothetical protein [Prescottella equi]NKS56602.1 hypothetical protein [Prescottella equi]